MTPAEHVRQRNALMHQGSLMMAIAKYGSEKDIEAAGDNSTEQAMKRMVAKHRNDIRNRLDV